MAAAPQAERSWPAPIRSDPSPGLARWSLYAGYDGLWWLALALGSPWLLWKSLSQRGFAQMLRERVLGRGWGTAPAPGDRPRILVHGVSVGEVKGALPFVRALEAALPECEVLISATTDTGLAVAHQLFPGRRLLRFPADLTPCVKRFFRHVQPRAVVLMELEIWPNFLRQANCLGIPLAVANGRITQSSFDSYRRVRRLLPEFQRISLVCAQNQEYAQRFEALGVDPARITVTGNLKADSPRPEPDRELFELLGPRPGQLLFVAGSTHAPEERLLFEAWQQVAPQARLVLVPRHVHRAAELERELAALGPAPQRLSALRAGRERPDPARPALVDSIGELERIYGLADLVFVGGSLLPHGGQNMLEPAAQGRAVLFGPSFENFTREAELLQSAGACRVLAGPAELAAAIEQLLGDAALRQRMGAAALLAVAQHRGATAPTLAAMRASGLLDGPRSV